MNIDGLSLYPLVVELDKKLSGSRIDKLYQPDKYSLIIKLRQPGEDLSLLVSANPECPRILLPESLPENPPVPSSFCMLLRKHLEDGRISKISQQSLDRIVTINVDIRNERGLIITKKLTIEIMGKHSNIVFSQAGVIIDAIRRIGVNTSRVRQILPGHEYLLPPGQDGLNLLEIPAEDCSANLRNLSTSLGKAIISSTIGIGPLTAREIAWRSGLSYDILVSSLDDADCQALTESIASIIGPLKDGIISPTVVVDVSGEKLLGIGAFSLEHLQGQHVQPFPTMSSAIEYLAGFQGKPASPEKTLLQKLIISELNRVNRKEIALSQELITADNADEYRCWGDILMANLYDAQPGTATTLVDLYSPDPEPQFITIPLNSELSILDNAKHYYTRYNKLKRAQLSLTAQLQECGRELSYLESLQISVEQGETLAEIAEIRQELAEGGYLKESTRRRPALPTAPISTKTLDGFTVFIGKNNRQNDLVTFKHGKPDDLWFHTKDIPGSHVILVCSGQEITPAALTTAATLAAYFSKARHSANVPVDYTRRRFVKKPSGAKPGFVIYEQQKTLYVTPDENQVTQLLLSPK